VGRSLCTFFENLLTLLGCEHTDVALISIVPKQNLSIEEHEKVVLVVITEASNIFISPVHIKRVYLVGDKKSETTFFSHSGDCYVAGNSSHSGMCHINNAEQYHDE